MHAETKRKASREKRVNMMRPTTAELVAKGAKIEKVGKDWVVKTLADAGVTVKAAGFATEAV